jgi:hypothetical protein
MSGQGNEPDTTFTIPEDPGGNWERSERAFRGSSVTLVALIVVLAGSGLFGVRTSTISGASDGYTLSVTYALISRPGLATPFSIVVATDREELPSSLTMRIDTAYLAILDAHGLSPEPTNTAADPQWTWWTFELPPGADRLQVDFDARLEPSVQWRTEGSVALMIEDEVKVESAIATWIAP